MEKSLNFFSGRKSFKQEQKLNLEIGDAVSNLELLINKVLPKNIFYQIILGRGLEFESFTDYIPGNDAEVIDWKESARAGKLLIRKYVEERDLYFMFIVDVSDNMVFGSEKKLKCEYSAEVGAALSHLILSSGDRVGFALFNEKIAVFKEPVSGLKQFDFFVNELSNPMIYNGNSNLKETLEILSKTLDRKISMVFIISDFVKIDESYRKKLESFNELFETVAIIVRDPLDEHLPNLDKEVIIENPETNERMILNPKLANILYERNALEQLNAIKQIFNDSAMDFIELSTAESFPEKIAEFLKERIKGGRKIKLKNVY